MKKLVTFLCAILMSVTSFAQNSGLGFNYQAVVRNTDGVLLSDAEIVLRISLYPGQQAATPSWSEIHKVHTDYSGSFGVNVGKGVREPNCVGAKYTDVNFSTVYYWIKIEVLEGDVFREISFSQLPSSPYSEVAYNATLFPAGMIVPFAGPVENIPNGWVLCDGAALSRSTYSNLFSAIGVCWGTGDGTSTFNIPDLRGMFLRGVSGESGNDPDAESRILLSDKGGNSGNNVGSYQGDAIRNITGAFTSGSMTPNGNSGFVSKVDIIHCGGGQDGDCWDSRLVKYNFDASAVVPTGGDNHPKNVYVNYIIKL